ncbi:DUF4105 domain-containing protein [Pacificoceanicola onchidii]|uniref:lipoprotein N-acyltransferase Lnb domain-containing protein n=1 Tax=Pacificoceanicola onchidii TaxID=2562685 RepID=UPI0010A56761|nr:DUF4105 domain-containing protein [Pacificoceanicola onchidii]
MKRFVLFVVVVVGLSVFGLWANWQLSSPSHDRPWRADFSRLPKVAEQGEAYAITNIRDWDYARDGSVNTEAWITAEIDPESLVQAWFLVEPFAVNPAIAHTMMAFTFEDGSGYIASVEARREDGEVYSAPKAAVLPIFEYMVVWATERDMYFNSAFWAGDQLYRYPLTIPLDQQKAVLRGILAKTAEVQAEPQWYNTLFANCTNVLAGVVNDLAPGSVPIDKSWVLTGFSDDFLYELGMIPTDKSFAEVEARAHVTPDIMALGDVSGALAFSNALRERLAAR